MFASEVIPGGRVYMQAMLLQFKGLEIDWARGLVRSLHSPWRRVTLLEGFWRDVHWWRSALRRRNCLPFSKPQLGELAVVGTDASDFACGELVWLDGTREEVTLVFTHAERRRPINFRELRGTLRALEVWGPRLRGRTILIETDNGFGHAVLSKMKSKSEDAQELVRRIHHLSLVYDLTLRSVHTPGKMLIRPDQTSRGASPSEPRLRLTRDGFAPLEQRFGPFDEYLGAERELRSQSDLSQRRFKRLWAHPDYDTVGSTLRLICQRLSEDTGSCARGVVVVPLAPEAGWWKLTRRDSSALSRSQMHMWVPHLRRHSCDMHTEACEHFPFRLAIYHTLLEIPTGTAIHYSFDLQFFYFTPNCAFLRVPQTFAP